MKHSAQAIVMDRDHRFFTLKFCFNQPYHVNNSYNNTRIRLHRHIHFFNHTWSQLTSTNSARQFDVMVIFVKKML